MDYSNGYFDLGSVPAATSAGGDVGSWSTWFQGISSAAVNAALGSYTYRSVIQPSGGAPVIAPDGKIYLEGQPGVYTPGNGSGSGGINTNTMLLMMGAALVLVLVLKD